MNHILCRAPSDRRSYWLDGDGAMTTRRHKAARIEPEDTEGLLKELRDMNEGWTFISVPANKETHHAQI